ncbi:MULTISPECIES: anthranilate synthase component I family protein [Sphingobacterium]|uniref:Anthranilate synthase component I family protein n=1 Tax=Sphingobacterium populi TaxID=1812824 RepID=A0ABW5U8J2_9SPHI|nr:anthranilate synthase component I family protein [Sphingobacterium sp. CFCC 11742]
MPTATFTIEGADFLPKAVLWAESFESACLLHSNAFADPYTAIESILAVGVRDEIVADHTGTFQKIENFKTKHPNDWMFGFFGYDLKNQIEELRTDLPDGLAFPDAYFFIPQILIHFQEKHVLIHAPDGIDIQSIYESICHTSINLKKPILNRPFQKRMSKATYLESFHQLKKHIQRGDIYEVNLCQEFYQTDCFIDPPSVYWHLNTVSPTPFSTFFKFGDQYILSASPERFIAKRGNTLLSQPIKGTAKRGKTTHEDLEIIERLRSDPKEMAENVMIVDLVRNDLTRSAKAGSVTAQRIPQVHTFSQVHQLVSTITCEIDPKVTDLEAIKRVFPAGSMTGAPKVSAMALCDRYEKSKRGVYAGAVGYFSPDGNFDFNVVIRTLLYNRSKRYLSFHTGGAITIDADAENEYAECLLKANAILTALQTKLEN